MNHQMYMAGIWGGVGWGVLLKSQLMDVSEREELFVPVEKKARISDAKSSKILIA